MKIIRRIRKRIVSTVNFPRTLVRRFGLYRKPKIFVVGRNKTGTTSLQIALRDLGFFVAPTDLGEKLLKQWISKDFDSIVGFCQRYDAFQDIPFSLAQTYRELDQVFPGSKFILTVRDDENQWFDSLCRFHTKRFGSNGQLPTWDDLQKSRYRYLGFIADCQEHVYGARDHGLYNKEVYQAHYLNHNEEVRSYFSGRETDFIEINVSSNTDYSRLCEFLGLKPKYDAFPWENKT